MRNKIICLLLFSVNLFAQTAAEDLVNQVKSVTLKGEQIERQASALEQQAQNLRTQVNPYGKTEISSQLIQKILETSPLPNECNLTVTVSDSQELTITIENKNWKAVKQSAKIKSATVRSTAKYGWYDTDKLEIISYSAKYSDFYNFSLYLDSKGQIVSVGVRGNEGLVACENPFRCDSCE